MVCFWDARFFCSSEIWEVFSFSDSSRRLINSVLSFWACASCLAIFSFSVLLLWRVLFNCAFLSFSVFKAAACCSLSVLTFFSNRLWVPCNFLKASSVLLKVSSLACNCLVNREIVFFCSISEAFKIEFCFFKSSINLVNSAFCFCVFSAKACESDICFWSSFIVASACAFSSSFIGVSFSLESCIRGVDFGEGVEINLVCVWELGLISDCLQLFSPFFSLGVECSSASCLLLNWLCNISFAFLCFSKSCFALINSSCVFFKRSIRPWFNFCKFSEEFSGWGVEDDEGCVEDTGFAWIGLEVEVVNISFSGFKGTDGNREVSWEDGFNLSCVGQAGYIQFWNNAKLSSLSLVETLLLLKKENICSSNSGEFWNAGWI